jgi:Protein of unknown function (DUF3182)
VREGLTAVKRGIVVVYFSRFGKPLQWHHKVVLDAAAKTIGQIKGYEFGGHYEARCGYSEPLFFVPSDTLLLDDASQLGIRSRNDFYGGIVPYLFAKTKAITHGLVDYDAERPLLLPNECGASCCRATPYLAAAMPGWRPDACSGVGRCA